MSRDFELAQWYLTQKSFLGMEGSRYEITTDESFSPTIIISDKEKVRPLITQLALKEALYVAETYKAEYCEVTITSDGENIYPVIEIIFKSEDEGADI